MALITCRDVSLGYEGVTVSENINFAVEQGEYLCIVGENGSGKSTLIKTLLRRNPIVSGEIIFGDGLKANEIGYLPQQTVAQRDFPASVREIVRFGCLNSGKFRPFFSKEQIALAEKNMQLLGISHLANRCYRELSGGQQQRVMLARALCATKKLLLLDEPVSDLDPMVTAELYELIAQLNRQEGIAVIMATHDIPAAVKYATRILHVGEKPKFFGSVDGYIKSDVGKLFIASSGNEAHQQEAEISAEGASDK